MSQIHATTSLRTDELISAAVRGLIAQRRVTPNSVALAVGVSRAALYRKLGSVSPWQADEVDRLARHFGVSRDSLYEGRADYATVRARQDSNLQPSDPKVDGHFLRPRRDRRRRRDWQRIAAPVRLSVVRCEDEDAA